VATAPHRRVVRADRDPLARRPGHRPTAARAGRRDLADRLPRAVRGLRARCARALTYEQAAGVGLEPTTIALTGRRSAIELPRSAALNCSGNLRTSRLHLHVAVGAQQDALRRLRASSLE